MKIAAMVALIVLWPATGRALTSVCVSVEVKSWNKVEPASDDKRSDEAPTGKRALKPDPETHLRDSFLGQMVQEPAPPAAPPQPTPVPAPPGPAPIPGASAEAQSQAPQQPAAAPDESAAIPSVRAAGERQVLGPRVRRVDASLSENAESDPFEIDPERYLKRLLEYQITHDRDFAAVEEKCGETMVVELYALDQGFTVFARYSGHSREEKVNRVQLDEFGQLAERLSHALLRDTPISETMNRENVLRADSEMTLRTVSGSSHLQFGLGTSVRVGRLETEQGVDAPVAAEQRILTPLMLHLGYRRKLKGWGMDAFSRVLIGTASKGARSNELGGHVDYAASLLGGLHFMRYINSAGINSLYFGGGASFELAIFQAIRPKAERSSGSRDSLYGGGLNFDLLIGYEFMRTSSVHFFAQAEVSAPTYLIDTERGNAKVKTYLPGGLAQIGVIF